MHKLIENSILRTCRHVCFITDVISNFIGQNVIGINIEPITARGTNLMRYVKHKQNRTGISKMQTEPN
jgi:hypothetical protein